MRRIRAADDAPQEERGWTHECRAQFRTEQDAGRIRAEVVAREGHAASAGRTSGGAQARGRQECLPADVNWHPQ